MQRMKATLLWPFYDAGMAPPIGGVDSGGKRSDFSFDDMAAISGSCASYIFTSLANFKTPEMKQRLAALF